MAGITSILPDDTLTTATEPVAEPVLRNLLRI
jgi:hypothetical protein